MYKNRAPALFFLNIFHLLLLFNDINDYFCIMQAGKTIFVLLSALVILMGANGFILEEYFCSGCNQEKHIVEFFEFGELNHEHGHCTSCADEHKTCSCHDSDHINNTKISYIALEVLYLNFEKAEVSKTTVIDLTRTLQSTYLNSFTNTLKHITDKSLLKIPPLLLNLPFSTDFCATFSVFRL